MGVFGSKLIHAVRYAVGRYVFCNDRAGSHNGIFANYYGPQYLRSIGDYDIFTNYRIANTFPFTACFVKSHVCSNGYILKDYNIFTNFRGDNGAAARMMGEQYAFIYFHAVDFTTVAFFQNISSQFL
jgi:hypothetical protein